MKAALFLAIIALSNSLPWAATGKKPSKRIKMCAVGVFALKEFCVMLIGVIVYHLFMIGRISVGGWFMSAGIWTLILAILFWHGMILVYIFSVQLGVKKRAVGIVLGLVPIANVVQLFKIIGTVDREVREESEKVKLNQKRKNERICDLKYPIFLVHGVFFRDSRILNYWGRIPEELTSNGAKIYYGEHQSAASVSDSAKELSERIEWIVKKTGCGKVNIIAHSKGGLDCRYAIENCGAAPYVASLTTINTPHRGCEFADYLLNKLPERVVKNVERAYNEALKHLGDENPDFISAVRDLTAEGCARLGLTGEKYDGIYCQSVGSKLNRASGGTFPMNFSYHLVKYFDGPNDGLVSVKSMQWGERFTFVESEGKRGVSHGDMVDLNRENIKGFDVREFYAGLVKDLKDRGL